MDARPQRGQILAEMIWCLAIFLALLLGAIWILHLSESHLRRQAYRGQELQRTTRLGELPDESFFR